MKFLKVFLALALIALIISDCNEDKSILVSTDPLLNVDKLYGIGFNGKAVLSWEVTSAEVNQFGFYRHTVPLFSYETATRIATLSSLPAGGFVDSGLVNGTVYYYTLVPERENSDGSVEHGAASKTTRITPFDFASIPTNQISYSGHIQTIFNGGCVIHGCHAGDEGVVHTPLQKGMHGGSEFSLRSWNDVLFGTDDVAQVVPYRATKSHMIQHLNSDTTISPAAQPSMPPGISFPAELRDFLIRWINYGAKNDDGTAAYSIMPARGWAYVTNQGEDITAVIDLDNNKIARYVTTGVENSNNASVQSPHNVVVDRQNQFYYVNLIGGSKLLKFRVLDNEKVGELTTGLSSPAQVALSKNGDTAYVSNFEATKKNITMVNTVTMTTIADIGSDAILKPHGITITPDFKYVLVCNSFSDNVSIVQTSTSEIVATIPVAYDVPSLPIGYLFHYEPYQSVVTPDSRYAYVTCRSSGEVRVIDLQQLRVIDSIAVGRSPLIPAITPDGEWVFAANRNSNSVSAISTSTRKVEYTIENAGANPHGVAVSKDGKYLYVSCENTGGSDPSHHPTVGGKQVGFLKIIDIETRTVIKSLEVGNFAAGISVTN